MGENASNKEEALKIKTIHMDIYTQTDTLKYTLCFVVA